MRNYYIIIYSGDHYRRPPVGVVGMDQEAGRGWPTHLGPGPIALAPGHGGQLEQVDIWRPPELNESLELHKLMGRWPRKAKVDRAGSDRAGPDQPDQSQGADHLVKPDPERATRWCAARIPSRRSNRSGRTGPGRAWPDRPAPRDRRILEVDSVKTTRRSAVRPHRAGGGGRIGTGRAGLRNSSSARHRPVGTVAATAS